MAWTVLPLLSTGLSRSALRRCKFNCAKNKDSPKSGETRLNDYIRLNAWARDEKGFGRTYVALSSEDSREVIGYYTLSACSIEYSTISDNLPIKLPSNPVPAILLGNLAVDFSMQKCGVGKSLLNHACQMAIESSEKVAAYAIVVDLLDQEISPFYLNYGFLPLADSLKVYLPIATLEKGNSASLK